MSDCERVRSLISGYLDNELTQQEQQQLRVHLASCRDCQRIHQDLRRMQEDIGQLRYPEPETRQLEQLMQEPGAAGLRRFGWTALIAGAILFASIWLVLVLIVSDMPWFMRLILILLGAGSAALFISVLRQRLIARKTDKYRRVKL